MRPQLLVAGAALLAQLTLVPLHGPGGQRIYVNPIEVTSIREPVAKQHLAAGTRCLIFVTNGNFITVTESCDEVRRLFALWTREH